ncbi:MAG: hypothetical protein JWN25_2514 [Verrucomicrobiales bacterium]|nr:hypothetical protein [Verrucomicrobiales bacterium]
MKSKTIILAALAGTLLTNIASAQVEVVITGSTAFRSIAVDRVKALFDAGFVSTVRDSNIQTYSGTMTTAIPSLGSQTVTVRMSYSGSGSGMLAVKNGTQVSTVNSGDTVTLVSKTPDLAFSDVFPSSANPPIATSAFQSDTKVGVVPFVYVKNNGMTGVNNITRDQAVLLMTAGGLMPATFLGGSSAAPIYLVGRDSGSGTRISVEKDIAYKGTPFLWDKDISGNWISSPGLSSGSGVAAILGNVAYTDAIGYLGLSDFATINTKATALTFDGVAYSTANVISGSYALWGYEHLVTRIGLSVNQTSVRTALANAITSTTYQHTDPNYVGKFEAIADMHVQRGTDGGTITSLDF